MVREAEARGLQTTHTARDRALDGTDLTAEQPFQEDWQLMEEGYYDGFHSGFDCGTWTRVRFNQWGDFPISAAPLRTRLHPLGLPANTSDEQERTDKGTCMSDRSLEQAWAATTTQLRPTAWEVRGRWSSQMEEASRQLSSSPDEDDWELELAAADLSDAYRRYSSYFCTLWTIALVSAVHGFHIHAVM